MLHQVNMFFKKQFSFFAHIANALYCIS